MRVPEGAARLFGTGMYDFDDNLTCTRRKAYYALVMINGMEVRKRRRRT